MSGLPENMTQYAATAMFTEKTVPRKLTGSHRTKPGVWGKLRVSEGALDYVIVGPPLVRRRIQAHSFAIIEPEVEHLVEVDGPVKFKVEFYRRQDVREQDTEAQTPHDFARRRRRVTRPLWWTLGVVSFGCGAAGTVLPLVPTTPFMLLSAYAFARSSPRLHRWLLRHPRFGPLIHNWQRHRAIGRRAKILAIIVMVLTPMVSWVFGVPFWVLAVQIPLLLGGIVFIVTRPEGTSRPGGVSRRGKGSRPEGRGAKRSKV